MASGILSPSLVSKILQGLCAASILCFKGFIVYDSGVKSLTDSIPPAEVVAAAVAAGRLALCAKSQRGVAIFQLGGAVSARGFNAPPPGWACSRDQACAADCSKLCIHAEAMAITEALKIGEPVRGAEMLHVKLRDGELVTGGGPSCWQCSKQMVAVGIAGMWLYENPGLWKRYEIKEFHRLTLAACSIFDNETASRASLGA